MRNSVELISGTEVDTSSNVENIVDESNGVAIVTPFFIYTFVKNQFDV